MDTIRYHTKCRDRIRYDLIRKCFAICKNVYCQLQYFERPGYTASRGKDTAAPCNTCTASVKRDFQQHATHVTQGMQHTQEVVSDMAGISHMV